MARTEFPTRATRARTVGVVSAANNRPAPSPPTGAGHLLAVRTAGSMSLHDEILEQPAAAARFLAAQAEPVEQIASSLRDRPPRHVVIAARGTSDHAAIYAQYVLGVRHRLSVGLGIPSIVSLYGVAPDLTDALVIGISQSGASPDIVGVVAAARAQGAPTIAITNDPASPLAAAAGQVIALEAGPERAIAATKTYTAELLAIALLSAALADDPVDRAAVAGIPDALAAALDLEPDIERIAADQAAATRALVLARGYEYATAREWALKLKELAHVFADPYSSADFQHGPVALVEPGVPVVAVTRAGAPTSDLTALLTRLRDDLRAELMVVSDDERGPRAGHLARAAGARDARVAGTPGVDRAGPAPRAALDARGARSSGPATLKVTRTRSAPGGSMPERPAAGPRRLMPWVHDAAPDAHLDPSGPPCRRITGSPEWPSSA